MNTTELKNIWQVYDSKLEKSLKLNLQCIEMIQAQKIKSTFTSLKISKIIEILIGVFFIFFLSNFLYNNLKKIYFVVAAVIVMIFCFMAIIGSIRQLIYLYNITQSQNVLANQKKIALLQSSVLLQASILKYLRLAFLSLPFYTAYIIIGFKLFFNIDIVLHGDKNWWVSQIIISIMFIPFSIWLSNKLAVRNINVGWVSKLIDNASGKSISQAMKFIKELDEFEKDLA